MYKQTQTFKLHVLLGLALAGLVVGTSLNLQKQRPLPVYRISKAEGAWLNRYHGTLVSRFNSTKVEISRGGEWIDITNWRDRQIANYGPNYFEYQCTTDSDCMALCESRAEQNCDEF